MTKEELHSAIQTNRGTLEVNKEHFITAYGNDKSVLMQGKSLTRADILARTYSQTVSKLENTYTFVRKES